MGIKNMLSEDDPGMNPPPAAMPKKGPGRGNWRRNKEGRTEPQPILPNTPSYGFVHESPAPNTPAAYAAQGSPSGSISFQPLNVKDHVPTPSYQSTKRNRPLTSHQQAVSDHRRTRVHSILDLGIRTRLRPAKRRREEEGVLLQAWKRIRMLPAGWDSEDEGLDKPKEDSKDKDKDGEGKNKLKEEDKAAAALRRAAGQITILGGFRLPKTDKDIEREKSRGVFEPDPEDDDDYGEQALYYTDTLHRYCDRLADWERTESSHTPIPLQEPPEPKHPYLLDWEKEEVEVETDLIAALTPRPRQARRRGGAAAGSRKSKGASTPATTSMAEEGKDDDTTTAPAAADDDEPMADGEEAAGDNGHAGDGGELDDDDRELLGEADGDETEDEDEGDDMDED